MTVVDSGVSSKGVPWLVMPKASSSLEQMLTNPFTDYGTAEWASRIMLGVLSGMGHAHERGVLHRDIKPQNILMFGTEPRISDFGIAKNIDIDQTRLTKTADELGTVRYMAPRAAVECQACHDGVRRLLSGQGLCLHADRGQAGCGCGRRQ